MKGYGHSSSHPGNHSGIVLVPELSAGEGIPWEYGEHGLSQGDPGLTMAIPYVHFCDWHVPECAKTDLIVPHDAAGATSTLGPNDRKENVRIR